MQVMVVNALTQGIITALIGCIVWLTIRRSVERRDKKVGDLEDEVKDLRDAKIKELKLEQIHAHETRGLIFREIREKHEYVRDRCVTKADCEAKHLRTDKQLDRMESIATDLVRVEEGNRHTVELLTSVNEKQIALGQDLARLEGSLKR